MNGDEKEWNRIFKLLYGKKYFIIGNHDTDNKILKYENDYNITNLGYGYVYKYNKKWQFFLSHYPTFTSSLSDTKHYPLINLYGHTHQNTNFFNENNPYMYHVGVDSHNCFPISIEQIIINIEKKKTECEKRGGSF
jgi:calcineurin-like phosphoesterase family protein